MPFLVITLPFGFDKYEPVISTEIMKLHYEQHYKGYMRNLNAALDKNPQYFTTDIDVLLEKINSLPSDIRASVQNNGGGVLNHELFWEILNPTTESIIPNVMQKLLFDSFMGVDKFKSSFFDAATKHFGSGWVWLVVDKTKKMQIYTTSNQDSPYMNGDIPIIGIDLWEHAYYLQYHNRRGEYLEKVWTIIDWSVVQKKYHEAIEKITLD